MFYVISKTIWFFAQPSSAMTILLVLGLMLSGTRRFARGGRRLAWTGAVLLIVCGLGPVANIVILPLEQRFPAQHGRLPAAPVTGIIVLGGYEDGRISSARGTLTLNEAAERFTETALLAHRLPGIPVVISGGSAVFVLDEKPAAQSLAEYLRGIGIAAERIKLEDQSITTYENALFSRRLLSPKPGQRWILVTSAAHMPRAAGAFRHQGFEIIAWPADFRTKDAGDRLRTFSGIPAGLKRLDEAVMEWAGLVAYRTLGRSDTLFPAP